MIGEYVLCLLCLCALQLLCAFVASVSRVGGDDVKHD